MFYFSELKKKGVYTEDNILVGKLDDLIFQATTTPIITKLVVIKASKEKLIIPASYILSINSIIILSKDFIITSLEENELHVVKNLLDKQIIDLKGNKVVRVNDVVIQGKDMMTVSGVDIGIIGIFRWLGIENYLLKFCRLLGITLVPKLLSWGDIQPLELVQGKVRLKTKEEKLNKIRPEDLADYLEKTNVINARKFLGILDESKAADVITNLNINYQTALFKHFKPEKAVKFISLLNADDAVDVLLTLSLKRRETILNLLPVYKKHELIKLLNLAKNPIGNLMTTQFLSVASDETVASVKQIIKNNTQNFTVLYYVYVVNKANQLVGVFNLHELLLHNDDEPIIKFMIQNVIVAHLTTPRELVLKRLLKYQLKGIPVINDEKQILGMISLLKIIESMENK